MEQHPLLLIILLESGLYSISPVKKFCTTRLDRSLFSAQLLVLSSIRADGVQGSQQDSQDAISSMSSID